MKIEYEIGETSEGKPKVSLSLENGQHIGTIWGTLRLSTSEFDRGQGLIDIVRNNHIIATIWNAKEKEVSK